MTGDMGESGDMLQRAGAGDAQALADLFMRHRERLHRLVRIRMHPRLKSRLDASDVLQEAFLEVSRCLAAYLREPSIPFFLWMRLLTCRKLQALHRHHLSVQQRAAGREVSLVRDAMPEADSENLAVQLINGLTTPSKAAMRTELQARVQEALERLEPLDREVLALRHFEQLTNAESAQVLAITEAAASKRFLRAVKRLKNLLTDVPEILGSGKSPDDTAL